MISTDTTNKSELGAKAALSFSVIYETENLSSVEIDNIYRSLASISKQTISPEVAQEFIIIDGGYAPDGVIEDLQSKYPWVTIHRQENVKYYDGKMLGASLASGEIVLFLDSDCEYVSDLFEQVLDYLTKNPEIQVVAGETSTPIRNPYELAIACHYFFPRYSKKDRAYESSWYFLNNVAFRRKYLLENPIPFNQPTYRGNCGLHSYYISQLSKEKIVTLPSNKTVHEPPQRPFIYWRYLLMGRDEVLRNQLKEYLQNNRKINLKNLSDKKLSSEEVFEITEVKRLKGIIKSVLSFEPFKKKKIRPVIKGNRQFLAWIPITAIHILIFEFLYVLGQVITYLWPNFLYDYYQKKMSLSD